MAATASGGDGRSSALDRDQTLARLRERIFSFAASHYSREFAEDLAQEVLLVLHEKYSHVENLEELVPLALRIVRFKISGHRRTMARRGEFTQAQVDDLPLPDPNPGPLEEAERSQMRERLIDALGQLGGRCREMFRLKLEGRSFEEIRRHFGVDSLNTVYTWDFRCRKQLLELMGGRWEKKP
jgi:RNA polymerase sigma-70 factor, ECF subfamily